MASTPNQTTLRQAIADSIDAGRTTEERTDRVLDILAEMKLVAFSGTTDISLLTVNGRVLAFLMEFPEMTQREIAARTGTSESAVARSISNLIDTKLVSRRKVRGNNVYHVHRDKLVKHPDFRRLFYAGVNLFD
jgi:predicted HTH transcriptional regulator